MKLCLCICLSSSAWVISMFIYLFVCLYRIFFFSCVYVCALLCVCIDIYKWIVWSSDLYVNVYVCSRVCVYLCVLFVSVFTCVCVCECVCLCMCVRLYVEYVSSHTVLREVFILILLYTQDFISNLLFRIRARSAYDWFCCIQVLNCSTCVCSSSFHY